MPPALLGESPSLHPSTLQRDLVQGVAALLRSEEGADLHLSCGGKSVFCHSLVLRLRCPKLLHALDRVDAPRDSSGRRMLTLPSILSPGPFSTVLAFIYTDALSDGFTDEQVQEALKATAMLMADHSADAKVRSDARKFAETFLSPAALDAELPLRRGQAAPRVPARRHVRGTHGHAISSAAAR